MIQTGKFRDANGTISEARVEAAEAYLQTDWETLAKERWNSPGFDPARPDLDKVSPRWRDDPKIAQDLEVYLSIKDAADEQMEVIKSGPDDEYLKAQNALLMCQRVDLFCAGPSEVEEAVKHLVNLGKHFNTMKPVMPDYITEFYPGVADLE